MVSKLFKKVICIFCFLAILMSFSITKLNPAKAIERFWVEVSDPNPGAIPTFKFHFSIEKKLEVHKYIQIIFPPGTTYTKPSKSPGIPIEPPPDPNPCEPCKGTPIIGDMPDSSVLFQFNTHIELDPKKEGYKFISITIPFDSLFNISNPPNPGSYIFKISTQAEPFLVESYPVQIFKSTITTPIVDVEAPKASEIAGFSLDFKTSSLGELKPENKDTIQIRFPEGFVFTRGENNIKMKWIMINDKFLMDYPIIEGNDFLIPVPDRIRKGSWVSIKIDCRVGIKTAPKPGIYQLLVATSKDVIFIQSTPFGLK